MTTTRASSVMTTSTPLLTPRPPDATLAPRVPIAAGQAAPHSPAAERQVEEGDEQAVTFGNLELRLDEMQALVAGTRVGLTVREFQVLAVLAEREDRVLRRAEIYRQVWGGEMKHRDRAVDVFVRKVRTKLAAVAPGWTYIHTHFGIGYRFAPEHAAPVE
jgi:DNA-binding response OmpR family regulator